MCQALGHRAPDCRINTTNDVLRITERSNTVHFSVEAIKAVVVVFRSVHGVSVCGVKPHELVRVPGKSVWAVACGSVGGCIIGFFE